MENFSEQLGLQAGATVRDYVLEREIGEGGMAVVWLARHQLLKRATALKFPRPGMSELAIMRFLQEGQAAANIKHPNVVAVYEVGEWRKNRYQRSMYCLAMEYIAGHTLGQYRPTDLIEALDLLMQITMGLIAIHSRDITHRDLKPDNIFIEEGDGIPGRPAKVAKISDFGIALMPELGSPSLTFGGMLMGTPAYMSPEQLNDSHAVDNRSDLYALGMVFWQVLSRQMTLPGHYPKIQTISDLVRLLQAKQQLPPAPCHFAH